ncbi:hypothetical protein KHA94_16420 [Bacillus sp. FJAT-49705]|uniref:Uncharacterized protein n=1 Tax=Cytobacillus citreus TaxID=2833586 RepID=A0ABS5NVA9_9BACI|nr:hypothetical protein [Cytobacillus citreus]MBS4191776.1 hypothetical protein [Cytobacillus citreus]
MAVLKKAVVVENKLKHNFILEQLQNVGITVSQQGIPLDQLNYEDLKYELVLASFRQKDVENENNGWF